MLHNDDPFWSSPANRIRSPAGDHPRSGGRPSGFQSDGAIPAQSGDPLGSEPRAEAPTAIVFVGETARVDAGLTILAAYPRRATCRTTGLATPLRSTGPISAKVTADPTVASTTA